MLVINLFSLGKYSTCTTASNPSLNNIGILGDSPQTLYYNLNPIFPTSRVVSNGKITTYLEKFNNTLKTLKKNIFSSKPYFKFLVFGR